MRVAGNDLFKVIISKTGLTVILYLFSDFCFFLSVIYCTCFSNQEIVSRYTLFISPRIRMSKTD